MSALACLANPFDAPVYHLGEISSTMDEARNLARQGALHGTAVMADSQTRGRGRGSERIWVSPSGESLLATIILCYPVLSTIPTALTLRVGLAVARALESLDNSLRGRLAIKWPNDILCADRDGTNYRKICGILCESTGRSILVGLGVNLLQERFPPEIAGTAASLAQKESTVHDREALLSSILKELLIALEEITWKDGLEQRLYHRGERVTFLDGMADAGKRVEGRLFGLGWGGELLLELDGEQYPRSFITGELTFE